MTNRKQNWSKLKLSDLSKNSFITSTFLFFTIGGSPIRESVVRDFFHILKPDNNFGNILGSYQGKSFQANFREMMASFSVVVNAKFSNWPRRICFHPY